MKMGSLRFDALLLVGCIAGVAACSNPDEHAASNPENVTEVQFALTWSGLPFCWNSNNGQIFYVWNNANFYVCNGKSRTWVAVNLKGLSAASRTTTLGSVSECATGGSRIEFGLDRNVNGTLDDSEVSSVAFVCNGNPGTEGPQGIAGPQGPTGDTGATGPGGATGLNSLVRLDAEPAGANCPAGGVGVHSGPDTNSNGNLEDSEVAQTRFVCHGLNGTDTQTDLPDGALVVLPESGVTADDVQPQTDPEASDGGAADTNADLMVEPAPVDGGPLDLKPLPSFVSVSAGGSHSCGVRNDGIVLCWGANLYNQSSPPATSFVAVSAGAGHTCGLTSTQTIACWGDNSRGQSTPPPGTFTAVSAGEMHTCALKPDGTALCWGNDGWGQSTPPNSTFTAITTGARHTCGLKADGNVICWGNNDYSQATPVAGSYIGLSAGSYFTCGLRTDGTIACWGDNYYGQGTVPTESFERLSTGGNHTCSLRTNSTIACWGFNGYGAANPPSGTFIAVSAGLNHTCAITTTGAISCWGYKGEGQITSPVM
jgi:hypothetical protein